jgi:hypothetical protein
MDETIEMIESEFFEYKNLIDAINQQTQLIFDHTDLSDE